MADELLTVQQAARRIGLTATTLYDWLGRSDRGLLVVRGCQHFDLACAVRSIRRLNHGHAVASFIRTRNVHGEAASPLPGAAGVMSRLALFRDVNMTAN